jgi:hypothetical protein
MPLHVPSALELVGHTDVGDPQGFLAEQLAQRILG